MAYEDVVGHVGGKTFWDAKLHSEDCDAPYDCISPATICVLFVMGEMKGARAENRDGRCSNPCARANCGSDVVRPTSVNHRRQRSRTHTLLIKCKFARAPEIPLHPFTLAQSHIYRLTNPRASA